MKLLISRSSGFTLIELSIALVIIGLIVGGVLVGRDLITASVIRSQLSQIESYNTAVNTFRGKYSGLPGDISVSSANQFGFYAGTNCSGVEGQRDNNGLIDGNANPNYLQQAIDETGLFWQDLSTSRLIKDSFPGNPSAPVNCNATVGDLGTSPGIAYIGNYMPQAKIAPDNFVYVFDYGSKNWFGISAVTSVRGSDAMLFSNTTIPASQAYKIDAKVDDGIPNAGKVQPLFINASYLTIAIANAVATSGGTSTSCYDTITNTYSTTQNNGSGRNCSLSFSFQ